MVICPVCPSVCLAVWLSGCHLSMILILSPNAQADPRQPYHTYLVLTGLTMAQHEADAGTFSQGFYSVDNVNLEF